MTKPIPISHCLDGKVVERSLMDEVSWKSGLEYFRSIQKPLPDEFQDVLNKTFKMLLSKKPINRL